MRIGVVADTHMFSRAKALPSQLTQGLAGVDLILHAGDWTHESVVELFEEIAPVDGVAGNNDGLEIIRRFGRRKLLLLQQYRVGIVHGDGGRQTQETAARAFRDDAGERTADIVIFGHSHTPYLEHRGGQLLLNPGSPTDKRRQPRYSYAVLTLGEQAAAELFYYDEKTP